MKINKNFISTIILSSIFILFCVVLLFIIGFSEGWSCWFGLFGLGGGYSWQACFFAPLLVFFIGMIPVVVLGLLIDLIIYLVKKLKKR